MLVPAFLLLAGLLLAMGCGTREEGVFKPYRLTDRERIESITSPWSDEILPFLSDSIQEGTGFQWDGSDEWFPFHPQTETQGTGKETPSETLSLEVDAKSGALALPGRSGVARVVPVLPNAEILVECMGSFGPGGLKARVSFLSSYIPLDTRHAPGFLRNTLKEVGHGLIDLKTNEQKNGAGSIVKTRADTRALLIMAYSLRERGGNIDQVKLTYLRRPQLSKDEAYLDNFVASQDRENCVMPSLVLTPGMEIVYKEMLVPERCRFIGSVGHFHNPDPDIAITLMAERSAGERVEILKWSGKGRPNGWAEINANLDALVGERVTMRLKVESDPEPPQLPDRPHTVYLGGPMLVAGMHDSGMLDSGMLDSGTEIETRPGHNVIIVSLDTLRHDHLGCYGYGDPVSPHIDRLAQRSAMFKYAYAPAPYTLPSHVSLFTSLYPSLHGIHEKGAGVIPPQAKLLAETLAGEGWITGSFNGGGYVSHDFGFHRGFDLYCEVDPLGDRYLHDYVMHEEQVFADGKAGSFDRAMTWLESVRDQRFFLFLHTFMIHDFMPPDSYADEYAARLPPALKPSKKTYDAIKERYRKNGTVTDEERRYLIHMYDGGIKASDDMMRDLLLQLDRLGIEDETVIIVLSDHGEEFMDHGALNHNRTLYEELIRIPLIIYKPGMSSGRVIERPASLVDVMPTVLDLLGLEKEEGLHDGRSLVADLKGASTDGDLIFAEVDMPRFSKRSCVIESGWKYIEGSTDETMKHPAPEKVQLFHLLEDPREQVDRKASAPEKQRRLERLLRAGEESSIRQRKALGIDAQESLPLDPALLEMLKQQGYL